MSKQDSLLRFLPSRHISSAAATLFALSLAACSVENDGSGEDLSDDDLLGGQAATTAVKAVGGFTVQTADGTFEPQCSGTLIAPTLVISAAHCPSPASVLRRSGRLYFTLDADSRAPSSRYEVVDMTYAPRVQRANGRPTRVGSIALDDIAVFRLATPVQGNTPVRLGAPPTRTDEGKRVLAAGYGRTVFQDGDSVGPKRMGTMGILSAGDELIGPKLAPSKQAFVDQVLPLMPIMEGLSPEEQESTHRKRLEDLFDVQVPPSTIASGGTATANVITQKGDSGGPLFLRRSGRLELVGVLNGGPGMAAFSLSFYSALTKDVMPWIESAKTCATSPDAPTCRTVVWTTGF
jgi:V8-like Glu-specific endopeptidase